MFSENTPPEFKTCPSAVKVNADRGQNSVVVTWPIPIVTDNSNSSITPRQSKGLAPGSRFTQGLHKIQYTAQDAAHNDAIPCWFTVTVGSRWRFIRFFRSFVRPSVRPSVPPSIHSFIRLFIHSFTHVSTCIVCISYIITHALHSIIIINI